MSSTMPLTEDNTPQIVTELLYRLKVRDVMTSAVLTARRDQSLRSIQQIMKENTITGVPVTEGNRLIGVVSMDDIIRALEGNYIDDKAETHMTRTVIVLEDDMPLAFGIGYMDKYRFGRFPVLDRSGALVGIMTSRDIIVHLLLAMNREMEALETKLRPFPDHSQDIGMVFRDFAIRRLDFENAGKPSSEIKKCCKAVEMPAAVIRRIAVASYELEMNLVIHSYGGTLSFKMESDKITITAWDTGPGIPDLQAALKEGFSTATEWIRSLGFGAGMGLPNVKRVSDRFTIESSPGRGTTVVSEFFVGKEEDCAST